MNNLTDTNQASEDDLELIVARISAGIGGFGKLTNGNRYDGISEEAGIKLLKAYIRTEKQKLLDKFENDCKYNYTTFGNSEKMLQVSGLLKRIEAERTKLEAEL